MPEPSTEPWSSAAGIDDREFARVLTESDGVRYAYFLKRVADWNELWSLWREGWLLATDDEGNELHPVWPHQRYAAAAASGPWEGSEPRAIKVPEWLDAWTPGIKRAGRAVVVFPTPSRHGARVDADDLASDLRAELSRIE